MSGPRVVCVSRRFWPQVGGAESAMAGLSAALAERGVDCTLLTAQWQRDWPREIVHHGVRVVRLPQPTWRFVGTLWYMRALARWLRANRPDFDIAYVSMLKHCAHVAVGVGREEGFPVVLRAEGAGQTGDCYWQLDANFGRLIKKRCLQADAIVAPSRAIERELVAAGYARARVHYLPNGVALRTPADDQVRAEVRASLAQADPALFLSPGAPLAVYTGRLHRGKGLTTLVAAWSDVTDRLHDARLWLVGEGPLRQSLLEQISDLGLTGHVVVTGPFDQVDDILQAADLFVLPSREEGMSLAVLEAMAAELPVVATRIEGNQALIEHDRHGLLVKVDDVESMAAAILALINDPLRARRLAIAARQRVAAEFSLERMAEAHVKLLEQLCAASARTPGVDASGA